MHLRSGEEKCQSTFRSKIEDTREPVGTRSHLSISSSSHFGSLSSPPPPNISLPIFSISFPHSPDFFFPCFLFPLPSPILRPARLYAAAVAVLRHPSLSSLPGFFDDCCSPLSLSLSLTTAGYLEFRCVLGFPDSVRSHHFLLRHTELEHNKGTACTFDPRVPPCVARRELSVALFAFCGIGPALQP